MIDEEIFDFLIDDASVRTLKDLLLPDANVIRLYEHYPEPKVVWWNASVPLSSGGVNRDLLVQSVSYDVEMSKSVFLDALDEIERTHGGLTLVQSYNPLPPDLHPRSFRRPKTLLRTLGKCSACLFFEMPHANETAGLSVFGRQHLEFLIDNHVIDLDGKQIALT